MLGVSISLNAISTHGTCTAVYVAVAAVIGFLLSSIQTLAKISFFAWGGLFCILTGSKSFAVISDNVHTATNIYLLRSSHCHYRSRSRRTSSLCTPRRSLGTRLQNCRRCILHQSHHCCILNCLCVLRHSIFLFDSF